MGNGNLKILYVDDSSVVKEMVESFLLELGYLNIEGAEDGIDALEKIRQTEDAFDFIITDINMPNMDGITFIKKLRGQFDYMSTPIMVLSTEWTDEMKLKGKEAGATSWIVKPFDLQLIKKGIEATLQKVNEDQ